MSLVYLAFQIRQNTAQLSQNTQSVRLAALDATVEAGNRVRELLILNPELADLHIKGLRGLEQLDQAERMRFRLLLQNLFLTLQATYVRYVGHALEPAAFEGSRSMLDSLLVQPGVQEWWQHRRRDFRAEFAEYVDACLRQLRERGGNLD